MRSQACVESGTKPFEPLCSRPNHTNTAEKELVNLLRGKKIRPFPGNIPNERILMKNFIGIVAFLSVVNLANAAVDFVPVRIDETRSQIIHDDGVSRNPPGLTLTLSLAGAEAESAIKYGDLTIDEAVDDTGANLLPEKDFFNNPKNFKDYDNAFFRKSTFGNRPPAAPQIELRLAVPKRSATKIARLRGTLSLASAGTEKTVELGNLKSPGKKKLDVPASANVTITVDVDSEGARSLGIEFTGDESAVESVEVVDASGRKVSNGISRWSVNNGPVRRSLELQKPLDDSMKLVAKITVDRKLTKVSFDLKDIPLP